MSEQEEFERWCDMDVDRSTLWLAARAPLLEELAVAANVWAELCAIVGCTSPDGSAELNQVRELRAQVERLEKTIRRLSAPVTEESL
jgi:hypothetical protein